MTKRFAEKAYAAFQTLGYRPKSAVFSYDDFLNASLTTLARLKYPSDAPIAVELIRWCTKHWKRINKISIKKAGLWEALAKKREPRLKTVPVKETVGCYLTNGLFSDGFKNMTLVGTDAANGQLVSCMIPYSRSGGFNFDGFSLRYKKWSCEKMDFLDRDGNVLCRFAFDSNANTVRLKDNSTRYGVLTSADGELLVVDRENAERVARICAEVDPDDLFAAIRWDSLNKNVEQGIANVLFFRDADSDDGMFGMFVLALAASSFLLFRRHMISSYIAVGIAYGMMSWQISNSYRPPVRPVGPSPGMMSWQISNSYRVRIK